MNTPLPDAKPAVALPKSGKARFELEALEARVLLSADGFSGALASASPSPLIASAIEENLLLKETRLAEESLFDNLSGEAFSIADQTAYINAPGEVVTLHGSVAEWGGNAHDFSGSDTLLITAGQVAVTGTVKVGTISMEAGSVTGASDALIQADNLRIVSEGGVGTASQPLQTQVELLEITSRGGDGTGVFITEKDGLTVGDVLISGLDESDSGVRTAGGDVIITTLAGGLSVRGPPGVAGIDSDGGNIVLTTDSIDLAASVSSNGGALVLQPFDASRSIGLADGAAGDFNLSSKELDFISDGFGAPGAYDAIVIGRADGRHKIQVDAYAFRDSVTLRTPILGGGINVLGALSTTSGAKIRFIGSYSTTTLNADVYTNGDDKLFEDSVVVGAGKNVTISTGPLGGNIVIEGLLDGTNDPGNLTENLTIIAGTGDVIIKGSIGSNTPLTSLTIISAGRVIVNGSVRVTGEFRIVDTTGVIDLGSPLVVGGQVGNVNVGSLNIATHSQVTFQGAVTATSTGSPAIQLAAYLNPGLGDVEFKGNLTSAGGVTVTTVRNLRVSGVVAIDGSFVQVAGSGITRFDKSVTAQTVDLTTSSLVFDDRVSVGNGGNLILTADEIDFNGGVNTVSSAGVDTSDITLRPSSVVVPVKLGTAAGTGADTLDLSNTDLNAVTDKFRFMVLGWEGAPNPAAAGQRNALTAIAAGGSTLAPARVEIRSPATANDLIFTARTSGANYNGVVVRIFDDNTMPVGTAEARYFDGTKLLTINIRLFDTTAATVLDAVNNHLLIGSTAVEFAAGTGPFIASGGLDYGLGTGMFETVISDKTSLGADAVAANATLLVSGADTDLLFTARIAGAAANGTTIALLNRDVPAVSVLYDTPNKVLTILARLADSPNGVTHTRAEIIQAINNANVAFAVVAAATDSGAAGEFEIGRATLLNPARVYGSSIRVSNNLTAPISVVLDALHGGITTPVTGTIATPLLTAHSSRMIQLNTVVDRLTAISTGNGDIQIGEADALIVDRLTSANGGVYLANIAGNITLDAAGAGISAAGGNVAVRAVDSVLQNAGITTTGGSISVQAALGAITMSSTSASASVGGNIRYAAASDVILANLNAGAGKVSVVAAAGTITDANGSAVNVQSAQLRLESGTTAGTGADALETATGVIASQTGGGLYVSEADDLQVASISVTVQTVNPNLSTTDITDASLNGLATLATLANGAIILQSVAGTITIDQPVSANGSGNVLVAALAAAKDLALNAAVSTGTGHISLLAGRNITQSANGDVTTGGGTLDVEAGGGSVTMADQALSQSGGGNIRYKAATAIALGGLDAGSGFASVIAGSGAISDAGDANREVIAAQARLVAGTGVGAAANPLELAVGTLAVQAGSVGIYLTNDGAVVVDTVGPVTVNRVAADGTTPIAQQRTDAALSDLVAAGGNIVLRTVAGSITVNSGAAPGGVSGAGNILLQAQGAGADLTLVSSVGTSAGSLSLIAARDVIMQADGDATVTGGTIDIQAQAGSVNMTDGATAQTGGGNLRVQAAVDILIGGLNAGSGQASLVATTGSVLDNGDADKDIIAAKARLVVGNGIGNGANLVDTAVAEVAAQAAAGGIYLADDDALVIGTVGQVPVNRVGNDGSTSTLQDAAGLNGEVTVSGNGRIVQVTLNGTLTVSQAVSANGSGNLLLQAQTTGANDKNLVLDATITSGSGRVSLVANFNVLQNAAGDITVGGTGTIDVEAENGSITMADGALAQTANSAIRYTAATNVALGGLNAGNGDVSIIALAGAITDNGDTHKDIAAGKARLLAGTGIAAGGNHLDLAVGIVTARAGGIGIFLTDDDSVTIGAVGPVVVYRVKTSGTTVLVTDAAQNGMTTTTGSGPIVQLTVNGELIVNNTVTANGSGNILLQSGGLAADITLNSPVVSGSGNLSIISARDVLQLAPGDMATTGGTIDLESLAGSITMYDGATSQSNGGAIRYQASIDVGLTGLNAGSGTVSVIAGRQVVDDGDAATDIAAANVRIIAGTGVGLALDALDLGTGTVAVQAGAGIYIGDADDLTIGTVAGIQVQRVTATAAASAYPLVVPVALSGLVTSGGDNNIVAYTQNGSLTVSQPVTASGAGNILLQSKTTGLNDKNVVLNVLVSNATGNITVLANQNLTQAAAGDLTTAGAGTIVVEAQNGSITMNDGALAQTAGGNIRYQAAVNLALGGLSAGAGDISVNAVVGNITDNGDVHLDVAGDEIRLVAGGAIGTGLNALDVSANEVAARAAGGIFLSEQNAVAVDSVGAVAANRVQTDGSTSTSQDTGILNGLTTTAANGPAVVGTLDGTLTVNQPVNAHGTGNILLQAQTAGANDKDVAVNAAVTATTGNISVLANRSISQSAAGDLATTGGTIDVEAVNSSISMANGAVARSSGGHIRYAGAVNVALGGLNADTGPVSVIAATGTISDAGDTDKEVSGSQLRLVAGQGIGAAADHLEVAVGVLAARAGAGLYVLNDATLAVDTVAAITVNRVISDGTAPAIQQRTDAAMSDVTAAGNLVMRTVNGSFTINDGTVPANGIGLSSASGNLLVQAQGTSADLVVNAAINAANFISLLAARQIIQAAAGDVTSTSGSVDAEAVGGGITMADGALTQALTGGIRYVAATDIALGGLNAGAANVSVIASGGSVTDAGDQHLEIQAGLSRITAGIALGSGANHLELGTGTVAAQAAAGGVFLTNAGALTVNTVGPLTFNRVGVDGATPVGLQRVDAALSDVTTLASNGSIVLITLNGSLTLNDGAAPADGNSVVANGSGNIRLETRTTGANDKSITVNAAVRSGSGRITVLANNGVIQAAAGDLITGSGTIEVQAQNGSITMADGAVAQTAGASVRYEAAVDVTLGGLNAGAGDVSVIAGTGSIFDGGDADKDVRASRLRLVAGNGIGTGVAHLDTVIGTLAARAGAGGIYLADDDALVVDALGAITVSRVDADGTAPVASRITDAALTEIRTLAGNGNIVLTALNGALTINQAVVANADGNVRVSAATSGAADKDLVVNSTVASGTGDITILANREILQTAVGNVATSGGTVDVQAANGAITMLNGALTQSGGGSIRYQAALGIALGGLDAGSGMVSLLALGGAITDAGDAHKDIIAGAARLSASVAIGSAANHLEVALGTLAARAAAGGIFLIEDDAIVVDTVGPVSVRRVDLDGSTPGALLQSDAALSDLATTGGNGAIILQTINGGIIVNDGAAAADGFGVTAQGSGVVLLETQTTAANDKDVRLAAGVQSGSGVVSVIANRDVVQAGGNLLTGGAGTIEVEAKHGSITMFSDARATTGGGNLRYKAAGDITVDYFIAGTGSVSITATGGSVLDGGDALPNVAAVSLRLWAGAGVGVLGASDNAIETLVTNVTARATDGGLNILEGDGLVVTDVAVAVSRVKLDATTSLVSDAAQSDVVTTAGNGSIVVRTVAGSLTLLDGAAPADGVSINANGSGNVLVAAGGTDSDLVAAADLLSGTGHVTALAARQVTFNAGIDIRTSAAGSIDVEAGAGGVTMNDNSIFQTGSGNVRLVADSDVLIGGISTGGQVSVISANGSILDAGDTYVDVIGAGLRLSARFGVGTLGASANAIDTTVATVSARAAGAGINLLESDNLTVGDVSVTVQKVQGNGLVAPVTDAVQSDLITTGGNGSIVVQTVNGSLVLTDGTAPADGVAIRASGSGNVRVVTGGATGNLQINADIVSATGAILVLGGGNVTFGAGADVITSGSVSVQAGGSLQLSTTTRIDAGFGDIRLVAATDAVVTGVVTSGDVSIIAVNGSILDGGDANADVAATGLRLQAANGVGVLGGSANALDTNVTIVSARAGAGGINILESSALETNNVDVTVLEVRADNSVVSVTDPAQSDLVTSNNGSIVVQTVAGSVVLNDGTAPAGNLAVSAHGTGNILLSAGGSGMNLTANADIVSGSGNVTLLSRQVTLSAGADVRTASAGTVNVEADAGNVAMSSTSVITSGSGDLRLLASGQVVLGALTTSGNVSVTATSGSITDAGVAVVNVSANQLRLSAGIGVGVLGASAAPLKTSVASVSVRATSGGINLLEATALAVDDTSATIQKVQPDATVVAVTDARQNDVRTTAGNGSVVIQTLLGSLVLNEGTPSNLESVSANGSGNVLLSAGGLNSDVLANSDVRSSTGHVTIVAARHVTFVALADIITNGTGSIDVESGGTVTMAANSQFFNGLGDIRVYAANDVIVGSLSALGNVSVTALAGTIYDGGDVFTNNISTAASLRMVAGVGIGVLAPVADALEISAATLSARAGAGGINLVEANALVVADATATVQKVQATALLASVTDAAQSDVMTTAGNGSISLVTVNGTLTLRDGAANANGTAVSANGSGNVLLLVQGTASDLVLESDLLSGTGHITSVAARSINLAAGADIRTGGAGTVDVEAGSASLTMSATSEIASTSGDIRLLAAVGTALGTVSTSGNVSITATTGSITDAGVATVNVNANGLRLMAGTGVGSLGTGAVPVKTNVVRASGLAGAGGINVRESNALAIGDASATIQKVQTDASVVAVVDAVQSDFITGAGNGAIVIRTVAGTLTLEDGTAPGNGRTISANGSGNVLVEAVGTATDVVFGNNTGIASGSGHLTVLAARDIVMGSQSALVTSGTGTMDVEAAAGNITMTENSLATGGSGDQRWLASSNVTLGQLSTTGNVAVTAMLGSILDAGAAALGAANATANQLRLRAGIGIGKLGTAVSPLVTNVIQISGRAAEGGISLRESSGVTVGDTSATVQKVQANATVVAVTEAVQSDLMTTSGNGSIVLESAGGSLVLNDGTAAANNIAISAHGSGNVGLLASGEGTDVQANADVVSGTGHISVVALRNITFAATADIRTSGGGTINVEAATGTVTMNDNTLFTTGSGDIRVSAQVNTLLGGLATTGNLVVRAMTGSILDAGDTFVDVVGNALKLVAGIGIGTLGAGANAIETTVNRVSAAAGAGGVNLLETDALVVDTTTAAANLVLGNGGAFPVPEASQSDIVALADGSVVVRTLAGTLTLNNGALAFDRLAVYAEGTGQVLLEAAGVASDIVANADINGGAGNITLLAGRNVLFAGDARLATTGTGTLDVQALTGLVVMSPASLFISGSGDIRVLAASSIELGLLSTAGNVAVTAISGYILDSGVATVNVSANQLRLFAGAGIGDLSAAPEPVKTAVTTLSARAAGGGIDILESNSLIVGDASAIVQRVQPNATLVAVNLPVQSDLATTAGNGSIVLATAAGSLTLNDGTAAAAGLAVSAHGTGNVLLSVGGTSSDLTANVDVRSGSGHLTLVAGRSIILGSGADLQTGSAGTVNVEAGASLGMSATSSISSGSGDIRIMAVASVTVGSVSTSGNISAMAADGSITDVGVAGVNFSGNQLRLAAGVGVGSLGAGALPVKTSVANLSARGASGGINILETNALTVANTSATVQKVQASGATVAVTDAAQSDLATSAGNGSIVLQTLNGGIILTDGTSPADGLAVRAHGSGNILVSAAGAGADLTAAAGLGSGSGHVTVVAARSVQFAANSDIRTNGSINVEAASGGIAMQGASLFLAGAADIRLRAATDVVLGGLSAAGNISVTAVAGSILDGGDTYLNASAAGLRLVAGGSIGVLGASADAIETAVATVSGRAGGDVNLLESDALVIGGVGATVRKVLPTALLTTVSDAVQSDVVAGGAVVLRTVSGALVLNDGSPADGVSLSATGNLLLTSGAGLTINGDILLSSGSLTVSAVNELNLNADLRVSGPGTIDLVAGGAFNMSAGAVAQTDGANIRIVTGGGAGLGLLDARSAADRSANSLAGQSAWGSVAVEASGSILDAGAGGTLVYASATRMLSGNAIGGTGIYSYRLQATSNLVAWEDLATITSTGTQFSHVDAAAPSGMRFYRVLVSDAAVRAVMAMPVILPNGTIQLSWSRSGGAAAPSVNPVRVETANLAAGAGAGGLNIFEASDVTVDSVAVAVNRVGADGSVVSVGGNTVYSDLVTTGNGFIVLQTAAGSITLNDGATGVGSSVNAGGAGNILIAAGGAGRDVLVNAGIGSGSGHVTVTGARQAVLNANVNISTGGAGTLDVEAGSGSLTMHVSSAVSAGAGDIRLVAGQDALLATVVTTGHVSVTAAAGSISSAGVAGVNLSASTVKLVAGGAIGSLGAGASPVKTTAATLSARAGAGGINILETDTLTIGDAGAVVQKVQASGLTLAVTDAVQGDLATNTGNGSIVLQTVSGLLDLTDSTANADGVAISAAGSGNILLLAGGAGSDLAAGADVLSSSGHISMQAARSLTFGGGADVATSGAGTIDLLATSDSIVMPAGSRLQTGGGNIRLSAASQVTLGVVDARTAADRGAGALAQQAAWGRIYIAAASGSILDADAASGGIKVFASAAQLSAGVRAGAFADLGLNPLEMEVAILTASTGNGGLNLWEQTAVVVDTVSVSVNRVNPDATIAAVTSISASDLSVTGAGALVLRTVDGSLTLNDGAAANGMAVQAASGNVLLAAGGAASDLALNADLLAGGASISLIAGRNLSLSAGTDVITSGAGTVDVEAQTGSVSMTDGSRIESAAGNLRVRAAVDVVLGVLDARTAGDRIAGTLASQAAWGSVSVTATAGVIRDADLTTAKSVNVYAATARFASGVSVGQQAPVNPLETELISIAILTGGSGLNILDLTTLRVDTVATVPANRVQADGTTAPVADSTTLMGAVKTGGLASIASDLGVAIGNYPVLQVVTTLKTDTLPNTFTGFYEQVISVSNPTGSTIDAVRIFITNLPVGVTVPYINGSIAGVPYVQYNVSLGAGQTVNVSIEFAASPASIPTAAFYRPEVVAPLPGISPPPGSVQVQSTATQLASSFLVTFQTLSTKTYFIQYSDDNLTWQTFLIPIAGTGSVVHWVDYGAPKTYPNPNISAGRFYRVISN